MRPHTVYTTLSDSFENDYDYQEYNDIKPVVSVSSLNTREAENEGYSDNVCRGEVTIFKLHILLDILIEKNIHQPN